jgi:hypothetical protein
MINTPKTREDYKILEEYISGDLAKVNHKKIEKTIRDLEN